MNSQPFRTSFAQTKNKYVRNANLNRIQRVWLMLQSTLNEYNNHTTSLPTMPCLCRLRPATHQPRHAKSGSIPVCHAPLAPPSHRHPDRDHRRRHGDAAHRGRKSCGSGGDGVEASAPSLLKAKRPRPGLIACSTICPLPWRSDRGLGPARDRG